MEVTLLLADSAQVSPDGKVFALGLGWHLTSTPVPPTSVVAFVQFSLTDDRTHLFWQLDLRYEDGTETTIEVSPQVNTPLHIEQNLQIPAPAPHRPEIPFVVPIVVAIGPLPLRPDTGFQWVLTIDQRTWRVPFWTRPTSTPQP